MGSRGGAIVLAVIFLGALGGATFGLRYLTRGVGTWFLAVLLAILWLMGIWWLVNALRGRPGFLARLIIPVVVAIRLRSLSQVLAHVHRGQRDLLQEIRELRAEVRELRAAMPPPPPPPTPPWKRALKAAPGLIVSAALGAVLSILFGYVIPSPPTPVTVRIVTPTNTTTAQPSAPSS